MTTNHNELLVLKIRSLIADKEMLTAQANLDLARGGEWRTDYAAWHGHLDVDIQSALDQAPSKHNEMQDEIEQLNIAGATAVEAANLFKQRAEKAEAEVERLRSMVIRSLQIAKSIDDPLNLGMEDYYREQIEQIEATLNQINN